MTSVKFGGKLGYVGYRRCFSLYRIHSGHNNMSTHAAQASCGMHTTCGLTDKLVTSDNLHIDIFSICICYIFMCVRVHVLLASVCFREASLFSPGIRCVVSMGFRGLGGLR